MKQIAINVNKSLLFCLPTILISTSLLLISSRVNGEKSPSDSSLDELRAKAAKVMADQRQLKVPDDDN